MVGRLMLPIPSVALNVQLFMCTGALRDGPKACSPHRVGSLSCLESPQRVGAHYPVPVIECASQAELLAGDILHQAYHAAPSDRMPLDRLLAVVRQLFTGRGSLIERAAELVDKRGVVRLTATGPCRRSAYQVSSNRGRHHMVAVDPVPSCTCEDFMFSVVKGPADALFVRVAGLLWAAKCVFVCA